MLIPPYKGLNTTKFQEEFSYERYDRNKPSPMKIEITEFDKATREKLNNVDKREIVIKHKRD